MTDESSNYSQHLSSAKYYVTAKQAQEAQGIEAAPQSPREPAQSGIDNALRWVSSLVAVMLMVAVGAVTWKHRQSLVDAAGAARESGFNPIRLVFRASGVDKKFADAIAESQRQTAAQFEEFKSSCLDEHFKTFDATSLWPSPGQFNGQQHKGR